MKIRLTMAQALLRFLANQYLVVDGQEQLFVRGLFGIFGHGNVTGLGEALEYDNQGIRFYQGHNEQGMAHAAIAFAKQQNRQAIIPCTSSIGPGATNMVTAAATATVNRIPLLLLPGDVFSCRQPDPVLQQLEVPHDYSMSVNDCFKPVSNYWDRIARPEQLMTACMQAMRVLTDPVETGTVTLCLPQDVQAESYDYDSDFFSKRLWYLDRQALADRALQEAVLLIKEAKQPLVIAGGGVHYALATHELAEFANKHAIPVAETQAGKSALPADNPWHVGGIGVTGSQTANRLAAEADLLIVIGSRLQDFTTASKTAFQNKTCRIIHLNVSRVDAIKMYGLVLQADAKTGLGQLTQALDDFKTSQAYQQKIRAYQSDWATELERLWSVPLTGEQGFNQAALLGVLNQWVESQDVIVAAAGSLPGDLHRIWQSKMPKDYHLEYGYSCMGYEVAAGLGVRMAKEKGEVYVLVGDGSFLMMHSELFTSIQERQKIIILIFDNQGYHCIKNLQESAGSRGFGNEFRYRDPVTDSLSAEKLSIDFKQYAQALGANALYVQDKSELEAALAQAKQAEISSVIVLPVAPGTMTKGYETWWRTDVAAVSKEPKVLKARQAMQEQLEQVRGC